MIRHTMLCAALTVIAVGCASVPDREAVEAVSAARGAIEQAITSQGFQLFRLKKKAAAD